MFKALKNILKPDDNRRALEFWTWFASNEKHYRDIEDDGPEERDHRIKVFLDHLALYNYELTFLTGQHKDGSYELIISADGIQKHFESVEKLVDSAPEPKGWRFIALKPPNAELTSIVLNDKRFALGNMQFARVNDPKSPNDLSIVIFHPSYPEEEQELHVVATFMLLDALLGERVVAEDLQGMDIQPLTDAVPQNVLRPVKALTKLTGEFEHAK